MEKHVRYYQQAVEAEDAEQFPLMPLGWFVVMGAIAVLGIVPLMGLPGAAVWAMAVAPRELLVNDDYLGRIGASAWMAALVTNVLYFGYCAFVYPGVYALQRRLAVRWQGWTTGLLVTGLCLLPVALMAIVYIVDAYYPILPSLA
jgi:hypothetical protein